MRKLLSCGLIAAFAIIPTAIQASAEPPPLEPVVPSESVVLADCVSERCLSSIR
jgi:hypothetical protein